MKQDEARAMIIREWLLLPPQERATDNQAATFAMRAAGRYHFRTKTGDRYQAIKGWLNQYIGRP
jgi:hypothetical protein